MADLLKLLNRNPAVSLGALAIIGFGLGSGAIIGLVKGILPHPAAPAAAPAAAAPADPSSAG